MHASFKILFRLVKSIERRVFKVSATRNKNRPWRPVFFFRSGQNEQTLKRNLDDSCKILFHLSMRFQTSRFFYVLANQNKNRPWRPCFCPVGTSRADYVKVLPYMPSLIYCSNYTTFTLTDFSSSIDTITLQVST